MSAPIPKDYLGDSVYAECDGYMIILTTDNGMGASNTIMLEHEVLDALIRYAERRDAAMKDKSDQIR